MKVSETVVVVALGTVLGLVIGSFLNVVIWRVPRGESVVRPGSHCPSCDREIRARDNIPVVSWLILRGRCRDCGNPISARYPAVELLTAVVFGLLTWHFGLSWELPAYLFLAAMGVALALIDIDHRRLPDVLTLPATPVMLALLLLPSALDHQWGSLLRAALAGLALFAFFLALALIYPAGMGLGDVKLAPLLGVALGWISWGLVAWGTFLGFALGAVIGVSFAIARRSGRKTAIPFGPFMLTGTLIALLAGNQLTSWYLGLFS